MAKAGFTTNHRQGHTLIDLLEHKTNISSQFGENGIINKIFEVIGTTNKVCVEFGGYQLETLSNIYPLWRTEGWHGVVIEGDSRRCEKIKKDFAALNTGQDLSLKMINRWVAAEGENSLDEILTAADIPLEFELCSIDVDSIDYHIWKGMQKFSPRVVIIEYNPTVPPHISMIGKGTGNYIGTAIKDIMQLGNEKGYDLVACTTGNAIFVKKGETEQFMHRNDLDKLFDGSCLTYVINSFDGGMFFSGQPNFGEVITRKKRFRLENDNGFHFLSGWRSIYKTIRYFIKYFTF